jgi:hypothetical protein
MSSKRTFSSLGGITSERRRFSNSFSVSISFSSRVCACPRVSDQRETGLDGAGGERAAYRGLVGRGGQHLETCDKVLGGQQEALAAQRRGLVAGHQPMAQRPADHLLRLLVREHLFLQYLRHSR